MNRLCWTCCGPFFLTSFRDLIFDQSASPLDYDFISNDTKFRNLVDYRLQLTEQNKIPAFERATSAMNKLINEIDMELTE
jgi:hypothetical protein